MILPTLRRTVEAGERRPSSGVRLPGIEGMRAAAACSILIWHGWLYSSPSGTPVHRSLLSHFVPDLQFGVTLFFTLSAFLLFRPFAATVLRQLPPLSSAAYLKSRALRILPCYWLVLFIAAFVLKTVLVRNDGQLVPGRPDNVADLLRMAGFAQNYTPDTLGIGIGPGWSLAVEVVFYLLLPVLAFAAYSLGKHATTPRARRLAALVPAAVLLLVGLAGKFVAANIFPGTPAQWGTTWHSVVELSFFGTADLFAFGAVLAVLYVEVEDGRIRLPQRWRQPVGALGIGIYLLVALTTSNEQLGYRLSNTLIALACALLLAYVVLPTAARESPGIVLRTLERSPFVFLGTVSYSIFLWQVPLVLWLQKEDLMLPGLGGFLVNTLILFAVTLALSVLTYRFVEGPAMRLKTRSRQTQATAAPIPLH